MVGWAYIMFGVQTHAAMFGPWAPALLIALIIAFVLAGYWLNLHGRSQHRKKSRKRKPRAAP